MQKILIVIIVILVIAVGVLYSMMQNSKKQVISVSEELHQAQEEAEQEHPVREMIEDIIETVAPEKVELRQETLEELFQEASKLVSMEYFYTNASEISDYRELFSKIKFAEEVYVFSYDGTIQAGIDLSKIQYDEIDNDNKKIHITLPEPEILSHELDMESFKFYGVKKSLLGSISLEEYTKSLSKLKQEQEKKLEQNSDFYNKVSQNAKLVLETLFANTEIMNEYKLKIDITEHQAETAPEGETLEEVKMISIPDSSENMKGKDFEIVRNQFRDAGFTNVTVEAKTGNLLNGVLQSGKVFDISVNGVTDFAQGDEFADNAIIKIYYYSKT